VVICNYILQLFKVLNNLITFNAYLKNMKKLFILITLFSLSFLSCTDEDDTLDVNYELILGEWKPEIIQVDLNQVYTWDYSCGDDFLLIENDSMGTYSLHFDNCSVYKDETFSYKMENLMLYIQESNQNPYRRKVQKLTATELILSDPDDWRVNYIKYIKK
jgi:hypothetical protein